MMMLNSNREFVIVFETSAQKRCAGQAGGSEVSQIGRLSKPWTQYKTQNKDAQMQSKSNMNFIK